MMKYLEFIQKLSTLQIIIKKIKCLKQIKMNLCIDLLSNYQKMKNFILNLKILYLIGN